MGRWLRTAENKKVIHVDLWENGYQDAEAKNQLIGTAEWIVSKYCANDYKIIPQETGFTIQLLSDTEKFDNLLYELREVKSFKKVY